MSTGKYWQIVNRKLMAKSLGELSYEGILKPVQVSETEFRVDLKSGVVYLFSAWLGIWDHLRVQPQSIRRIQNQQQDQGEEAAQFFIDAQSDLEMTDVTLGNFLEEMQSTLFSDLKILAKNSLMSVDKLASLDGNEIQTYLDGHPKILLNKGRMGWGVSDLDKYSPESAEACQLHWIAILKEKSIFGLQQGFQLQDLYDASLTNSARTAFESTLKSRGLKPDDYYFIPVHPWQWDRIVQIQFAGPIAYQHIVSLGLEGDFYRPQISLRTLSNVSRPKNLDLKLSVSVLNTSAVRGIPSRYMTSSPEVSSIVARICTDDSILRKAGTEVLEEKAGLSFQQPFFQQVKGAPYRYQESLGVIWRESVFSKLQGDELGINTGSLFHQDLAGKSLIGAYIQRSGLSVSVWLKHYFEVVVIPLYHLQLKYGIGLVAHGQNIVLKMKNFVPSGVLIKDFQGDLRISNQMKDHPLGKWSASLDSLPPEHLIHDLITGHLLTVLRFVSEALQESEGFIEKKFYEILAGTVQDYLAQQPDIPGSLNLLNPQLHRVLLNKVRFKIGYADSAERPLPMLGMELLNPLSPEALHD